MSDPDRVLLFADEDCDDDREPVTVHTLGNFPHHLPRLQVEDKQRLSTFDFGRSLSLLFHPREVRPLVVAEIDRESNEFVRPVDLTDALNRADTGVYLIDDLKVDDGLDLCELHVFQSVPAERPSLRRYR